MICKECGAELMETDQFCPKCGTRVIKETRCPDCGAVLREGTKFCHKCGRLVGGDGRQKKTERAEEVSMDAMEQNILSETAAEIKAGRSAERTPQRTSAADKPARSSAPKSTSLRSGQERTSSDRNAAAKSTAERASSGRNTSGRSAGEHASAAKSTPKKTTSERPSASRSASGRGTPAKSASGHGPASGKRSSIPEPPRKKRINYREDDWEDEDYQDDDDWEDEDWDDEDGIDVITIMTVIVGCVLLIVVAVLGYNLYRQYAPKNYEREAEATENDTTEDEDGQQQEPTEPDATGKEAVTDGDESGTYQIIVTGKEVNVRDQPSTTGTNILTVAREGDVFNCYGTAENGQWYEIRLEDGTPGFVFHEYISVIEDSSMDVEYIEEQYIQE